MTSPDQDGSAHTEIHFCTVTRSGDTAAIFVWVNGERAPGENLCLKKDVKTSFQISL